MATQRAKLANGRRLPLTVSVDPDTHAGITQIARGFEGNRSAVIEHLVRLYFSKPVLPADLSAADAP
jgi:hypothetical protein